MSSNQIKLKIGIKYCGGCNPNYERANLVKRAKRDYPNDMFMIYSEKENYDLVVVICGCMEECFTFACSNSRCGILTIRSEDEYERLRVFMKKN